MAAPQALVQLLDPWATRYSDSTPLQVAIVFVHLAALAVGGGVAIALDRGTLRARRDLARLGAPHLEELHAAHRVVLGGLALSAISGVLMFAGDVEGYWGNWMYWVKMGLVVLLLANGGAMTRVEGALRADPSPGAPGWGRLRVIAVTSLTLWLLITLFGVLVVNAS